jgi:hypothetical protein
MKSPRKREGRCYELALRVMLNPEAETWTLVHGSVVSLSYDPPSRIGHAWIELPDGRIYDPASDRYEAAEKWQAHAIIDQRYSRVEACRIFTVTGCHCGPWTDAERADAASRQWGQA